MGGVSGRHADPFSSAMTSYLAGRAGTVTAAVYDVRTGQTWSLGDGQPQATASIVKIDILETLLAVQPAGLTVADRGLAQSMIENSDNDAATALWNEAGGPAGLRSYNVSVGLRQTAPSACLACAGFPWPGWGLTTTTPADQVLLLRQLVDGPLLSRGDRAYVLSLMENVEPGQRWGVSTGVPAGVRVALKNGWVPLTAPGSDWQINSEGWVSGGGRDYLVAVLATGNPSEQYGIDTLNALSSGKVNFTIFQDPYLQGFLPVLYMYLYNLSGGQLAPPDTDTGLTILNKGNVGQFLKNSRFQGGASAQAYLPRPAGAISQPAATTST